MKSLLSIGLISFTLNAGFAQTTPPRSAERTKSVSKISTFEGDSITFSEYETGTVITNQYAAKGAIFSGHSGSGNPEVHDYDGFPGRILHSSDWFAPLKITFVNETNSSVSKPILHFRFTNPLSEDNIIVKAYDASNNLVQSYTNFGIEDVVMNFDIPVSYVVFDDTLGTAYVIDDIYFSTDTGLPVELSSFAAKHSKNGAILTWETKSESDNYGWEIERKSQQWEKIGFVSGKGTTTEKQTYQFNDAKVSGKFSYRLKQIDNNGSFTYSNTLTVDFTPEKFGLEQNYPNPFNPSTAISYQLSAVSNVKLVVFDLLGREVATLVNEQKPAGNYTVTFSALNLPSGMYFYSLQANGFKQTRSMILMK